MSAACSAVDRRRRAPPRQWSHRPHLARQFADQGPQPSLGGSTSPRPSSAQVSPAPTRRWKPSATSWRARSGLTIHLPPSTLMRSRATSKRCSPASPRFGRCRPKFGILVDGGGVLPLADVTADIMVRAHGGQLAVQLDGGTLAALCAPSALAETVKALALAFLRLSAAAEREAAPHARAGDGGWRGGDLRRGWSCRRPRALPDLTPEAKSPIGLISLGYQRQKRLRRWAAFRPHRSRCACTRSPTSRERYGDGSLRTTPWRALLLSGVAAADVESACR